MAMPRLLAAAAIGFLCSSACAQEREDVFAVPHAALEALAARCDLVLKCKITDAADPQKMYLQCPGLEATAPTEIYHKYTADTEFPLKDAKELWPKKVTATFPAGGIPVVIYTPAKPKKSKDDPTPDAFYLPRLEKGKTYLLMLVKLPGTDKNVYYLPNNPQCVQAPDEEYVAAMSKALDQKNWPWSKPVNGLQMAMFASYEIVPRSKASTAPADGKLDVLLHMSLALKNSSDKPMAVNPMAVNPGEGHEYISITAASGGAVVKGEVYKPREVGAIPQSGASVFLTCTILMPGQVAFITPYGREEGDFAIPLRVAAGKWTLTTRYESTQAGNVGAWIGDKSQHPLWVGTVEAPKCDLDVGKVGGDKTQAVP